MFTGNLGMDAEIKTRKSDEKKYIQFSVANNEKYKDNVTTTWVTCFISNPYMVDSKLIDYLKKGQQVIIEGKHMKADIYTNDAGESKITYSINVDQLHLIGGNNNESKPSTESKTANNGAFEDDVDDLPF